MPVKKSKRGKKGKQVGGWFWERDDPIFGASNRWIGDKVITPVNNFLKDTKVLSTIAGPAGVFLGGPGGAIAGTVATAALKHAGYGKKHCRPSAKHMQHGCGSPFMLTHNSSFNSIKL